MPPITKSKTVTAGGWRTLEWFWNTNAVAVFVRPTGAKIKVRYGDGWPFGKNSQEQTLDGEREKQLTVGRWSILAARMQIKVTSDANVQYEIILPGP